MKFSGLSVLEASLVTEMEEVFVASGDVWMWADEKEKYGLL